MGGRLRLLVAGIVVIAGVWVPSVANGAGFAACWVADVFNPTLLRNETVTRCRISGGSIVDYASDSAVPSQLYAQTGTDLTGQCWYYTSA